MSQVKSAAGKMPQLYRKLLLLVALGVGSMLVVWGVEWFLQSQIYHLIQAAAFAVGDGFDRWFRQQSTQNPALLIGFAFLGGLAASISPCILSLLPVNLSYIGTREINCRRDAFLKASAFVLGVVTVLSLLGLFSALASFVFVQFRGYFHVLVGALIVSMGLSLAGLFTLPLPSNRWLQPLALDRAQTSQATGAKLRAYALEPFIVGLTFALVSSPCTSPIMVSVLAAGSATGSQLQSTLVMLSYALGYTMIIFLASLFTGLAKQTHGWLQHAEAIGRVASIMLLLVGLFYLVTGAHWVISSWQ